MVITQTFSWRVCGYFAIGNYPETVTLDGMYTEHVAKEKANWLNSNASFAEWFAYDINRDED